MQRKLSLSRALPLLLAFAILGASAAAAQPSARASFSLSRGALAQRARHVPVGGRLRLVGVPLEARTAVLNLERFEVFTNDARVLVQGTQGVTAVRPPSRAYFRGGVEGEPDSLAFLAVGGNDEIRGLVVSDGRMHVLGAEQETTPAEALIVRAVEESLSKKQPPSWQCDAGSLAVPADGGDAAFESIFGEQVQATTAASAQYSMVVAIETDYELYALFNSVDNAAAYVGDLMGAMSSIYYRDIGTTLRVNLLSLWTGGAASDPWTSTSTLGTLCQFGTWWHANRPPASYPRGTAHLLSGKTLGGGVAWLNAVCSSDFDASAFGCSAGQFGGGYGITGNITGSFNPLSPTVVWDIFSTSHEIGHNFGTPHTHCYNNIPSAGAAQPVDQCRNSALSNPPETFNGAQCYTGAQSLPAGGKGSIMSYCHLLSGAYSNIALSFGAPGLYGTQSERVSQRMRDFVASRPLSCRTPIDAPPADFNGDGRSDVVIYRNGAWLEFPFWPGK